MASNFASRELCPRHRPLKPRSRPPSAGTHMTHSLSLSLSQKQQFTDIPTSPSHLIFDQSSRIIINKRNKHCLIKFFFGKILTLSIFKKKKITKSLKGREISHFLGRWPFERNERSSTSWEALSGVGAPSTAYCFSSGNFEWSWRNKGGKYLYRRHFTSYYWHHL